MIIVPISLAGAADDPNASASAGVRKQLKQLKRQVATLQQQVATLEAKPSPTSPASLPPSGAAGGDLTGTYPSPTIAGNAVAGPEIANNSIGASEIINGSVGFQELGLAPGQELEQPVSPACGDDPSVPHNMVIPLGWRHSHSLGGSSVACPGGLPYQSATIVEGGYYLLVAQVAWPISVSVGNRVVAIVVDGIAVAIDVRPGVAVQPLVQTVSGVFPVLPGDPLTLQVFQSSGAPLTLSTFSATATYLRAVRLTELPPA